MIAHDGDVFSARFGRLLTRLAMRRLDRIPFVQQMEVADCGAACLAMVLRHLGSHVEVRKIRERLGSMTHGTTAGSLIEAARTYGLRGRGVSLEIEGLRLLPSGAILHWGFDHFMVFERLTRTSLDVVDPALGRRRIPLDQVRRSFTGVALILERDDGFVPAPPGRSALWNYFRQLVAQRRLITRVVSLSVALRVFALAMPLLTAVIVDRVVPRGDAHLLLVVGLALGTMLAFQFLCGLIREHLLLQLRTNLDTKLTLGFLDHLVSLPYGYFQRRSAGDLMLRVGSNAVIRETLASTTLSALLDGAFAIGYLGVVFAIHAQLGVATFVLGIAQALIFVVGRHRVVQLSRETIEARSRAQGELVQVLAGIETLKMCGAETRAVERWADFYVDDLNATLRQGRLGALLGGVTGLIGSLAPLTILLLGAASVVRGELSLGTMLAVNALAGGFMGPLLSLVNSALSVQQLGGHIERIDDVLSEPREELRPRRLETRPKGRIELARVSYRYGAESPDALRDVSLTVEAGSTVAIVGSSGSGKSTLVGLLLGLRRPTSGRVLCDDIDLPELDPVSRKVVLGVVPQNPFIFGRSIRDNIALVDEQVSLDDVVEAARKARIHDDIAAMPMGYDTIVAEGGASLSGGQRQRIALARALVHRPPVIVLDEATSSVDNVIEREVMDNLKALSCTRIIVAHRLSTIAFAEQIIVLEHGQVVERGKHDDLMALRGVYRRLVTGGRADA
jgi:ATP-binding cassette, subfamily B, bacterial